MNWEAIGAIGEILGAIAVVVSLIYLAVQIRANQKEVRLAAMHEISVGFRESISTFADPQMAELFTRANLQNDTLTDAETLQLVVGMQRIFRVWEEAHNQYRAGRLDKHTWDTMIKQYSSYLAAPGFQMGWELRRQYYDDDFREFVDKLPRTEYTLK
jgi:hypothetical protein